MPATQAICDQAKTDFLLGTHQPTDTYKFALYTQAAATLNSDTAAYTTVGEITGSGYVAGGAVLSGQPTVTTDLPNNCAYFKFPNNPTWVNSTITADCALLYNASKNNKAIAVFTFTSTSSLAGTFSLVQPTGTNSFLIKVT